jgi:hypothetical protein
MLPCWRKHAELDELLLARHVQRERGGERAADVQASDRVAKGRCDLPLALPLRNDGEQVRKPGEVLLLGPCRREPQVALKLPGERAERLRAPVVLEVELARAAGMQVPSEPVGLDLRGPGPDPVLGAPGVKAVPVVALEASARAQKNAFTPRRWARSRFDR